VLVSGPDIIARMKLFVYDDGNTFFSGEKLVHDRETTIESLAGSGSKWVVESVIPKEPSKYINEVSHCFGRTLAIVADEQAERNEILELAGDSLSKPSWLKVAAGANGTKAKELIYAASSDSDRCILAVIRPKAVNIPYGPLRAFSVIDAGGPKSFSLSTSAPTKGAEAIQLSSARIGITKDGCFAVATAFVHEPKIPQFTLPQHVLLFRLSGTQNACN